MPARHWQAAGAVLAGSERAREGHAQHTDAVLAATSELNWSTGHVYGIHAESPDAVFELPGGHAVQVDPSLPVYPALQVQAVTSTEPTPERESSGHGVQVAGPGVSLYVSAPHCRQGLPFRPVHPAKHSQAVFAVLPLCEREFTGQSSQASGPVADLYFPVSHAAQLGGFPVYPALHTQMLLADCDCELEGQVSQVSM